jgi:hypothetical protein
MFYLPDNIKAASLSPDHLIMAIYGRRGHEWFFLKRKWPAFIASGGDSDIRKISTPGDFPQKGPLTDGDNQWLRRENVRQIDILQPLSPKISLTFLTFSLKILVKQD